MNNMNNMNMDNFNLNIDNYSVNELEELLSINRPYSNFDILKAKELLKRKLMQHPNLRAGGSGSGSGSDGDLLLFIDNISIKLSNYLNTEAVSGGDAGTYEATKNDIEQIGSHFLIKNNNSAEGKKAATWNGRNVDTNEYPPGHLNPINIKTIKRSINIDTKFRPDYYNTKSTDFTVSLPERINKIVSMRLSSIKIPMSFYAVSNTLGNNSFVIQVDGDVARHVVLPPGNYECRFSNSTRAAYIEHAVNDAMSAAGVDLSSVVFTVDLVSGRSVFAAPSDISGGVVKNFSLLFNVDGEGNSDNSVPILFRLGWQLGYRGASYNGSVAISEGVCFVNGPQYVYVAVNDYNNSSNNFFRAAFSESILSPHILGRINITRALQNDGVYKSGQDDNYNDSLNRTREYFGPVDIQRLSIALYDEYGRVLDLNNMDWSFVLSFVCLYD
jgi:hypothetical protein